MSSRNRPSTGSLSERGFQTAVCELATYTGWRWTHFRTVRDHNNRYLTPLEGSPGFPDLVLVHPERGVLFVELKTATGRLTDNQKQWGADLEAAGAEYHLWRPDDWNTIKTTLGAQER